MPTVVISIGSNYGDKESQVKKAIEWLKGFLQEFKVSDIYTTPCAMHQGQDYLNAVVTGKSGLDIELLNTELKDYERAAGRDDECRRKGRVPIDIDIVMSDGKILKEWDFRQQFFKKGYQQLLNT